MECFFISPIHTIFRIIPVVLMVQPNVVINFDACLLPFRFGGYPCKDIELGIDAFQIFHNVVDLGCPTE